MHLLLTLTQLTPQSDPEARFSEMLTLWWCMLCTTTLQICISLTEKKASEYLTVLKITPLTSLNTQIHHNTLIPAKPN